MKTFRVRIRTDRVDAVTAPFATFGAANRYALEVARLWYQDARPAIVVECCETGQVSVVYEVGETGLARVREGAES